MIASENPNRPRSHWLQTCALLCVLLFLCLGVTHAQDHKAVGKRLEEAVAKGEITKQQAAAMMAALRKEAAQGKPHHKVTAVKGKPAPKKPHDKMAVVKGKPAPKKPHVKVAAVKGKPAPKKPHVKVAAVKKQAGRGKGDAHLAAAWEMLQARVKAGKLTEKQAHAKMAALKGKPIGEKAHAKSAPIKKEAGRRESDIYLQATWEELQAMVKAGDLAQKQGYAIMAALKKRMSRQD